MHCCLQHSGKRFSVFRGDGEEELRGAGGMSRMFDFNSVLALGEVLDALGAHFASFFRIRFQHRFFIDFSLISASIWEGLGEVRGPKMGKLGIKHAT